MRDIKGAYLAAAMAALLGWCGSVAQDATAQKIVCWKDKSGKTVGCGDKVPPEYQDSATRELDKRGMTRKTNESAEELAKRKAQEKENEQNKAELDKKAAEQKRQDSALINTYTNEKEIDLRRDRDLATLDGQINQLKVMQKNAVDRQSEIKARIATAATKGGSDLQKEDLARAEGDQRKADQGIGDKEKERDAVRKRYADQKARYIELKGGSTAAAPAPAPAAPAKK